nr:hypothetical protein GCM10020092_041590 [Actinoplanes digitatis]
MTARFNDGDTANNRGGSQHVKSGNAANNDPMLRGDFKGLVDKLDYIKGLGFSAIWITPVVLNRSDYDYHGYHGWDFYRVDSRLETAGNTYQDLIDKAHAKGIKIYQDVVYNHSSRWGAKGLFTPTVYGVRDAQWSWYYDQKNAGFAYDGLTVEPTSGKSYYNGDIWSTTEPVGNTCLNWGKPTGGKSAEGYTLYNCQWPSPTSGMFPAEYYHRCWIGNWEGEDARSCWIHEDLADFNTESTVVQNYLIDAYNRYIDMGVDGFRVDTAVHIPRSTWNRRFLPAIQQHAVATHGEKGKDFYVFGEVAAFVHDKWNRGSVNHSAQFFTWKERKEYSADDIRAAAEQFEYENLMGPGNQPTSTNAFLNGNTYHAPDHSKFSGMNVIDMRMHMNFGEANNAFYNGKDSDDSYNDATYNAVYVDSHDYGPNKSSVRYSRRHRRLGREHEPDVDVPRHPDAVLRLGDRVPGRASRSTAGRPARWRRPAARTTATIWSARSPRRTSASCRAPPARWRRPWPSRWSSTCSGSTRSAGRSPPSRRGSTPPRASPEPWRSSAASPPAASTASRSSPSPARPRSPASRTAPTSTRSPVTRRPSATAR